MDKTPSVEPAELYNEAMARGSTELLMKALAAGGPGEFQNEKDYIYYGSDSEFLKYLYKQVDDTPSRDKHILRERILLCTKLVMALGEKENRILGAFRIAKEFPANFNTDGNVINEDMKQGKQEKGNNPLPDQKIQANIEKARRVAASYDNGNGIKLKQALKDEAMSDTRYRKYKDM